MNSSKNFPVSLESPTTYVPRLGMPADLLHRVNNASGLLLGCLIYLDGAGCFLHTRGACVSLMTVSPLPIPEEHVNC